MVVIPLQLPSLTMIQCYWCISNTCSSFPKAFATKGKVHIHQCKDMLSVLSSMDGRITILATFPKTQSSKLNTLNSTSKGEVCMYMEMALYLLSVLIIIIEAKSFWKCALIPIFFLLTQLTVSHRLSPHLCLSSFLLHSLSPVILPPLAIALLSYSSPSSHLQHYFPHVFFSLFSFPFIPLLSSAWSY